MTLRDRRVQYETAGLDRADLVADPVRQFTAWYEQAAAAGVAEPNAFTLSSIDHRGVPNGRVVLARGVDERGVTFYTNYASAKSREVAASTTAAGTFAWLDLHRQVRFRGDVVRLSAEESDAYLEELLSRAHTRFGDGPVPRPEGWGGWLIVPTEWEFWQGRPSRLHDRFRYTRSDVGWVINRLAP
jgi:pyridoxamine 5'-phosphate oxidase